MQIEIKHALRIVCQTMGNIQEKWFRRNCTEVVGRECSAAEKADFIVFSTEIR